MPVSDVEIGRLRSFFSRLWGVIWRGKAFRYQLPVSNKKRV